MRPLEVPTDDLWTNIKKHDVLCGQSSNKCAGVPLAE